MTKKSTQRGLDRERQEILEQSEFLVPLASDENNALTPPFSCAGSTGISIHPSQNLCTLPILEGKAQKHRHQWQPSEDRKQAQRWAIMIDSFSSALEISARAGKKMMKRRCLPLCCHHLNLSLTYNHPGSLFFSSQHAKFSVDLTSILVVSPCIGSRPMPNI